MGKRSWRRACRRANLTVMRPYAELVQEESIREPIFASIGSEYLRTVRMLEEIYGGALAERRASVHNPLARRESALQVLHARQIALLGQWRREPAESEPWQQLLSRLLETVNAIAAGLGTTG